MPIVSNPTFETLAVSDRFPEKKGWYYCLTEYNQDSPVPAYYTGDKKFINGEGITHWLERIAEKKEELFVFTKKELAEHDARVINDYCNQTYFK